MIVTSDWPNFGRRCLRLVVVIWGIALVGAVPGCAGSEQTGEGGDASEIGNQRSDEVEQIAAAMEVALKEADLGAWRIVEPVTFRFGVSAETRSSRVATIAFTCMFSIKIENEKRENLVRNNGRLVYHQDQWKLQQVGVAFKFFDEDNFTDESDLLVTEVTDDEKLTVLKGLWKVTVRDTVAVQMAEKQYEQEAAKQEAEKAKAVEEAEEEAKQVARKAKVDALTEAARIEVMARRLSKIAKTSGADLEGRVEGVDDLELTGGVDVSVEMADDRFRGEVTFRATPRDVVVEYAATRFGRPWVYGGLAAGGGWDGATRSALSAYLDKRLIDSRATGK